eukprot:gene1688-1049_t
MPGVARLYHPSPQLLDELKAIAEAWRPRRETTPIPPPAPAQTSPPAIAVDSATSGVVVTPSILPASLPPLSQAATTIPAATQNPPPPQQQPFFSLDAAAQKKNNSKSPAPRQKKPPPKRKNPKPKSRRVVHQPPDSAPMPPSTTVKTFFTELNPVSAATPPQAEAPSSAVQQNTVTESMTIAPVHTEPINPTVPLPIVESHAAARVSSTCHGPGDRRNHDTGVARGPATPPITQAPTPTPIEAAASQPTPAPMEALKSEPAPEVTPASETEVQKASRSTKRRTTTKTFRRVVHKPVPATPIVVEVEDLTKVEPELINPTVPLPVVESHAAARVSGGAAPAPPISSPQAEAAAATAQETVGTTTQVLQEAPATPPVTQAPTPTPIEAAAPQPIPAPMEAPKSEPAPEVTPASETEVQKASRSTKRRTTTKTFRRVVHKPVPATPIVVEVEDLTKVEPELINPTVPLPVVESHAAAGVSGGAAPAPPISSPQAEAAPATAQETVGTTTQVLQEAPRLRPEPAPEVTPASETEVQKASRSTKRRTTTKPFRRVMHKPVPATPIVVEVEDLTKVEPEPINPTVPLPVVESHAAARVSGGAAPAPPISSPQAEAAAATAQETVGTTTQVLQEAPRLRPSLRHQLQPPLRLQQSSLVYRADRMMATRCFEATGATVACGFADVPPAYRWSSSGVPLPIPIWIPQTAFVVTHRWEWDVMRPPSWHLKGWECRQRWSLLLQLLAPKLKTGASRELWIGKYLSLKIEADTVRPAAEDLNAADAEDSVEPVGSAAEHLEGVAEEEELLHSADEGITPADADEPVPEMEAAEEADIAEAVPEEVAAADAEEQADQVEAAAEEVDVAEPVPEEIAAADTEEPIEHRETAAEAAEEIEAVEAAAEDLNAEDAKEQADLVEAAAEEVDVVEPVPEEIAAADAEEPIEHRKLFLKRQKK